MSGCVVVVRWTVLELGLNPCRALEGMERSSVSRPVGGLQGTWGKERAGFQLGYGGGREGEQRSCPSLSTPGARSGAGLPSGCDPWKGRGIGEGGPVGRGSPGSPRVPANSLSEAAGGHGAPSPPGGGTEPGGGDVSGPTSARASPTSLLWLPPPRHTPPHF